MPHEHLTPSDRVTIESLLVNHFGVEHIANQLKRPVCTVRREIARNAGPSGRYTAVNAQRKHLGRREACRPNRKLSNAVLEEHVKDRLADEWSPEQIAGRLPIDFSEDASMRVSHETIYAYVYAEKRAGGILYQKLRQSHRKRQKRANSKSNRGIIKDRVLIHERPAAVEKQSRFGDWEGDSVIGKNHRGAIATFVERKSLYTIAALMRDKCAASMCKAARNAFGRISKRLRRTLTVDNGKEFTGF
ncbi:MAG: IS30 family transposase, partial [Candidatus Hydrogenedentes bacterium]|nr:IS30 family transposase [Candidatus Hydrogenedentota bacterium]